MWLAALLLAGTPVSARTETRTTRSGDRITLANDHVEAVFRTSEAFDIETLRLNGRELLEAGRNRTPWILYYKGTQGESPELKPEHALALYYAVSRKAIPAADLPEAAALEYLRKGTSTELLPVSTFAPGLNLVTCRDIAIGWAKRIGNRYNNLYPAPWRILHY